jgi:hypothetical protein
LIDGEWKRYAEENGVKGGPKTNGIKPVMVASDEKDEYGEPIKVESDQVVVTFKTNVKWPNGNDQVVKVLQHDGKDITQAYRNVDWAIGEGSTGVIHGVAQGNNVGRSQKVTLYLSAVQIGDLVKYEGQEIDAEEIDGDDIDLGENYAAIDDAEGSEEPAL